MSFNSGHARYRMTPDMCCAPRCDAPAADFASIEVPLCQPHHIKAEAAMMEHLSNRKPKDSAHGDAIQPDGTQREISLVYYFRFADRIKIGTTTNIRRRATVIAHDELLAVELGDRFKEAERHGQFKDARVNGEWFDATPELVAHAAALRTQEAALPLKVRRSANAVRGIFPKMPHGYSVLEDPDALSTTP